LAVSAPFHCPLMAPAADALARHLASVRLRDPRLPVVTSVDARVVRGGGELRDLLVRQVTAPVRWEETMRVLAGLGAKVVLETGSGRVLGGLARRIVPGVTVLSAGAAGDIDAVREALAA